MQILTSAKNPRVLAWRSLRDKKGRDEQDAFLVEGTKMVREALSSGFRVQAVLIREGEDSSFDIPVSVPVYLLPSHIFQSVCDTRTPQGVAAVLSRRVLPISGTHFLALDGIQDPGNMGTMIRTADAAGFDGLLLSPDCVDIFSPKVLRATMGSIFRMSFAFPESLPSALLELREKDYSILSSQFDGDPFYSRNNVSSSFVLIVGNEGNGISDPVKSVATHHLCLPMRGGAESLNAAVAAGIMMYDLMKNA